MSSVTASMACAVPFGLHGHTTTVPVFMCLFLCGPVVVTWTLDLESMDELGRVMVVLRKGHGCVRKGRGCDEEGSWLC